MITLRRELEELVESNNRLTEEVMVKKQSINDTEVIVSEMRDEIEEIYDDLKEKPSGAQIDAAVQAVDLAAADAVGAAGRAEAAADRAEVFGPRTVKDAAAFFALSSLEAGRYSSQDGLAWDVLASGTGDFELAGKQVKVVRSTGDWNILSFGADVTGTVDSTPAFVRACAAMVDGGGVTSLPPGTYKVSENIRLSKSGSGFIGSAVGSSIVKATALLPAGSFLFTFGNKDNENVVTSMSFSRITLDMVDAPGRGGYEQYGIRDTGNVRDIYVKDNTLLPGFKTGQAGGGAGGAARRMCEGNSFQNVWVIGGPWDGGSAIMLDGILESNFIGGGVRGYSSRRNTNAVGIAIGTYAETRAMTLIGATTVMLKDVNDGSAKSNTGIKYGAFARECQDTFTTFEGITGPWIKFDGAGGLPVRCRSIKPRVYSYAQDADDDGVNANNYFARGVVFGHCQYCSAEYDGYSSAKLWAVFEDGHGQNQRGNSFRADHTNTSGSIVLNNISFGASSDLTNYVYGVAAGSPYWANRTGQSPYTGVNASGASFTRFTTATGLLVASDGTTVMDMTNTSIIPRVPIRNLRITRYNSAYSASVTPNMAQGADQVIPVNNTTAFTINAPTNVASGETLMLTIRNIGGVMGTVTFDPIFKVSGGNSWTLADGGILSKPANGFSRCITFRWNGSNWVEISRTPSDVPN